MGPLQPVRNLHRGGVAQGSQQPEYGVAYRLFDAPVFRSEIRILFAGRYSGRSRIPARERCAFGVIKRISQACLAFPAPEPITYPP
jgi:hypothetical protein